MPTYDTRTAAILAAFRGMRPGESLLLHRKIEGFEHDTEGDTCPCKPVAVERRAGQTEREFLRDVQERLGN